MPTLLTPAWQTHLDNKAKQKQTKQTFRLTWFLLPAPIVRHARWRQGASSTCQHSLEIHSWKQGPTTLAPQ